MVICLWPNLAKTQVIWSSPVTIAADTDVLTNGSLVYAYDWGNNNTTVNGVNFAGSSSAGGASPNVAFAVSTGSILDNTTAFGSTSATPFTSLSAAYQSIL